MNLERLMLSILMGFWILIIIGVLLTIIQMSIYPSIAEKVTGYDSCYDKRFPPLFTLKTEIIFDCFPLNEYDEAEGFYRCRVDVYNQELIECKDFWTDEVVQSKEKQQ